MSAARARAFVLALGAACGGLSVAASDAVERDRLTTERAAVEARFAERERECLERFAVTPCVEAAKRERRTALAPLRRQEADLEAAQRRQRAADREAAIKARLDARKEPPAASSTPTRRIRQAQPVPTARPAVAAASGAASRKSAAERRADEARSKAAFEARQQAAQGHREAVARRNAQRAEKKRPAPLPVPADDAPR